MQSRSLVALVWGLSPYVYALNDSCTPRRLDANLQTASLKTEHIVNAFKETVGAPGLSVCVSVGGNTVFSKGFGLSDVEQNVPATPNTKYRIASVSKCFTSLLVGRLLDQGKLSLDEDIKSYLPDFSPKTSSHKTERITLRHLLSHTSGIRSYRKNSELEEEGDTEEMLNIRPYDTAQEALSMFCNDDLIHPPGADYSYTTHGYTLISAVVESVVAKSSPPFDKPNHLKEKNPEPASQPGLPNEAKFKNLIGDLFTFLGLRDTYLDFPNTIIPYRTRQYRRDKKGLLINAPWVDNSYKWGGGGVISSAPDLIKAANHLCHIYLTDGDLGVVLQSTLKDLLWKPVPGTVQGPWLVGGLYGLGWFVARRSGLPADAVDKHRDSDRLFVGHLGGAIGGTTALLISLPLSEKFATLEERRNDEIIAKKSTLSKPVVSASSLPPISVAILTNLENATGIGSLAVRIVELFTETLLDVLNPL